MGRKLDLSGLTDDEAEHVLKVVQRDMKLRKKEEDRLSEMKQELAEEGSRCLLLAKQHKFNEHCCIRCCCPFTFLLNPKRPCLDCQYNICRSCRTYSQRERGYICSACQKSRLLRTQSLEWYYNNVKSRFKRFGSAKVLKTLYRKHIIERGALSELPEVSAHEGSNDNEESVCGSDSTFYRQSEGHSMADTLTVALRVAEEAIEEAIAKAESCRDSLEKQNEARYLRDHREELIEELATTIVQKIIQRGKRSEMQAEYDFVWPQTQSVDLPSPTSTENTLTQPRQHSSTSHSTAQHRDLAQASLQSSYSLWRSRSAFSLTSDDSPEKAPEASVDQGALEEVQTETDVQEYSSLRRESRASSLPGWKSVDRLDNSSASSVLQSPDGNWIALQSSQHSRPSLLTKRKSLVFSVLEKESGVVSAYDEMGSDSDPEDQGGWAAALIQFRRKLSDETYYTDSQHDPEWTYTQHPPVTSPSSGQYTNTETLNSDSETSTAPTRSRRSLHNPPRKKGPPEPYPLSPHRCLPPPQRHEVLDVNFNPRTPGGDSSEAEERGEEVRRARRRRRSKREPVHNALYSAAAAENNAFLHNAMMMRRQQSEETVRPLNCQTPDTVTPPDLLTSGAMTPEPECQDTVAPNSIAHSPPALVQSGAAFQVSNPQSPVLKGTGAADALEQQLRSKLCELVGQVSEKDVTSSKSELVRRVSEKWENREREKEREKQRQRSKRERERERERSNEGRRERSSEREQERSKRETEGPNDRRLERQISRERDTTKEFVRQRQERDRERQRELERQVERERERQRELEQQAEREREKQREMERRIERDWERQKEIERQVEQEREKQKELERQMKRERERQSEIERELERERKNRDEERRFERQRERQEQVNGADEKTTPRQEEELQEVVVPGRTSDRGTGDERSAEERKETKDKPADARARSKPQRSKSERESRKQGERRTEEKRARSPSSSPDSAPCSPEDPMSPTDEGQNVADVKERLQLLSSLLQQKYSAASLCSITTEVLKVLNATEDLIGEAEGKGHDPVESPAGTPMSSGPGNKKLDQRLTKMEENVYLAAGTVYGLEGALSELEDCARSISSSTTETEIAYLEDQVATAAAQVQQSELQISDIEARISALKTAGLNVSACTRFPKYKPKPKTLDMSRQQRRKLPAPPVREKEARSEPQMSVTRP
ncbi:rab effector MyRIP [Chanos chanos]|uniref:Rab effector MyRIP n=1 Tax=Chanos chanos TaxID=29144 RepID=A0A6J2V2Q2_CHACN|nr:rab effector MyRIP [Chanos chanos]